MRRLVLALVVLGATARADADPATQAKKLFDEGRALVDRGEWDVACVLFAESYELDRQPGTGLNLGECAERAREPRKAWLLFDTAAIEFDAAGKTAQAKYARDRADALAPKLATVIVRVEKPGTKALTIEIAEREVPVASQIIERLDAGQVTITATAEGREPFEKTVTAIKGREVVVQVPPLRRIGGTPDAEEESGSGSRRAWKAAFFTTLVVAAGTAGYSSYAAVRTKNEAAKTMVAPADGIGPITDEDCDTPSRITTDVGGHFAETCRWHSRQKTALYFSLGLGAVVLATAYMAFAYDHGPDRAQSVSIAPSISADSAGAVLHVQW